MSLPHREVLLPAGKPKGVILNFHGGGWINHGPAPVAVEMAMTGPRWQRRGWAVATYTYTPGAQSYFDAFEIYDWTRKYVGKRTPIIVSGSSAGGHLALCIASRRGPQGVIVRGAPTDLCHLGGEGPLSDHAKQLAVWAFGDQLRERSPAHLACKSKRVLLARAVGDKLVPSSQSRRFRERHTQAKIVTLSAGSIPWVHAPVPREALRRYYDAELQLLQTI